MNPLASASLYVGDLHPEVTEPKLHEVFRVIGNIASIRLCRDAFTRRSLGYAYVNFYNPEDAERALNSLNYTDINGQPCRIMWCHRDPSVRRSGVGNIFIKNLDAEIDNKALYDTFSQFGNILSCKVAIDEKGNSRGYGFVHFETQDAADKAITGVDGMEMLGKTVNVSMWKSHRERVKHNQETFTNVYVKNLLPEVDDEQLKEMFSEFGEITSAKVMVREDGSSREFGFVNFAESDDAKKAVDTMNNKEVDGKTLFVSRAQKKNERRAELAQKFASMNRDQHQQGVNLYVKNLDENIDNDVLYREFSTFGTITSHKVMTDEEGNSRGFGFVCFSTPEEATRAISEMNNRMLASKPLYVALAQKKEVRRANLEAQRAQRMVMAQAHMGSGLPQGMPPGAPPTMYPGGAMFYPQMPQQYPFQQPRPRWMQGPPGSEGYPPSQMGNATGAAPGGSGGVVPGPGFIPPSAGRGGSAGGSGRGGRGGAVGGRGGRGGSSAPRGAAYKFNQQARNRGEQQQGAPGQMPNGPAAGGMMVNPNMPGTSGAVPNMPNAAPAGGAAGGAGRNLSTILSNASSQDRRQILGEHLYPKVEQLCENVEIAPKVTGMLLQMAPEDVLLLLESQDELKEKVLEAINLINSSNKKGPAEENAPTESS